MRAGTQRRFMGAICGVMGLTMAAAMFGPVQADEKLYICAVKEARECTATTPCKKVELRDIFLSPLIVFDLENKVIVSAAMDDRGRKETIVGTSHTGDELIVYGHGDNEAWNTIISLKTGNMTGNINSGEINHVLFGHCAPHKYP